jgi:hypothetical protein
MNRDTFVRTDPFISSNCWVGNAYSVMLSMSREYCSPPDVRNVSDDRIHPQRSRGRVVKVESTVDGDVVIVQPSFEDDSSCSKSPFSSPSNKNREWQARSPQQESKTLLVDSEERNPCSPGERFQATSHHRRHTRNLSALFDATSIGRCGSSDSADVYSDAEYLEHNRNHKRVMSNGLSDPNVAHRRLNSIGNSQNIYRRQYHQREHSAGLDILSAAVDASKDELAQAAGEQHLPQRNDWEPPSTQHQAYNVALCSYPQPHHLTHSLQPHMNRRYGGPPPPGVYVPVHGPYSHTHHGAYISYPVPAYFAAGYTSHQEYPIQQYPSQHSMHPPHKGTMYPPENRYKPHATTGEVAAPLSKESEWNNTNQGPPKKFSLLENSKSVRSIVDVGATALSHNSHHRKMSSFSSVGLGNIFCSSIMSPVGDQDVHPLNKSSNAHHRSTSSTVSFLNGLDVVGTADETFLRNLHESSNNAYQSPTPMDVPKSTNDRNDVASNPDSPSSKLASGGTSKRVRRKCTVAGCINRVVQGGLCISHGAKRKLCSHPGCTKNVKKSGLCSTHGPARKRCDAFGCKKVAVQGGRCIAHGARKKLCDIDDCGKQAILCGMCKKHHDQIKGGTLSDGSGSDASANSKKSSTTHKPSHTRGLSIFHEIHATEVESIINAESTRVDPDAVEVPERAVGGLNASNGPEGIW